MVKAWELHRGDIEDLYMGQNKSLKEVVKIMKDRHGFHASIRGYKAKLDAWGCKKYRTENSTVARQPKAGVPASRQTGPPAPQSVEPPPGDLAAFDSIVTETNIQLDFGYGEGSTSIAKPPSQQSTVSERLKAANQARLYGLPQKTGLDQAHSRSPFLQDSPLAPPGLNNHPSPEVLLDMQGHTSRSTSPEDVVLEYLYDEPQEDPRMQLWPPASNSRLKSTLMDEMSFLQQVIGLQATPRPCLVLRLFSPLGDAELDIRQVLLARSRCPLNGVLSQSVKELLNYLEPCLEETLKDDTRDTYHLRMYKDKCSKILASRPGDDSFSLFLQQAIAVRDAKMPINSRKIRYYPFLYIDVLYKNMNTVARKTVCLWDQRDVFFTDRLRGFLINNPTDLVERVGIVCARPIIHWRTDMGSSFI